MFWFDFFCILNIRACYARLGTVPKQIVDVLLIKILEIYKRRANDRLVLIACHQHLTLIVWIVLAFVLPLRHIRSFFHLFNERFLYFVACVASLGAIAKQVVDIFLIKVAKVDEGSAIDRLVLVAGHPHLASIVWIVLALILSLRSPFFWVCIYGQNIISMTCRRLNLGGGGGRKVDGGQK